jgi:hypothetical protein
MTPDRIRQWHRLFGITLTDLFRDTPWQVELEKELALQSQLLDVVIIEQTAERTPAAVALPDGLEGLRAHNLLTYKSHHEALDGWALDELIGHYVNYRKLASPPDRLIAEEQFQLYAVATRAPQGLAKHRLFAPTAWPGVFEIGWGTHAVRLIVLGQIAEHPRNAAWELFSRQQDRIRHGAAYYPHRHRGAWELLRQLYVTYALEEPNMAYTMEEFIREAHQQFLHGLTPDERRAFLEQLSPEERLRGLGPEERLRGLGPEERLRGLGPEERLRGLDPEQIKAYLKKFEH